jgi:hypothetical protein
MSAKKSHLSQAKYGYDMVVAVTQNSINDTLRNFLSSFNGEEFIQAFELNDDDNCVLTDYQLLRKDAGNINIFDIPDKADKTNSSVAALKKANPNFCFAFKAKMGLPEEIIPADAPDIIQLTADKTSVEYQLYFSEFTIVKMTRGGKWSTFKQPGKNPWIFTFLIDLDLRTDNSANSFSKLPRHIQDKVKNLNPDTMFSVQQLYLNLNTAGLSEKAPQIENLDNSNTDLYNALNKTFLGAYWQKLKKDGDIILGYVVRPEKFNPQQKTPSIIPTEFSFQVSPYLDFSGKALPDKRGLYTLNYLVMSENRSLPAPVQFEWNWIDETEKQNSHGVMSVKREVFATFLKKILSPALSKISLKPWVKVESDFPKMIYKYNFFTETAPQTFVYENSLTGDNSRILSFTYAPPKDYDEAGIEITGIYANLSIQNTIKSDVYLTENKIKIISSICARIHINLTTGTVEGDYVKLKIENEYQISVTDKGDLKVTLTKNPDESIVDESEPIDAGFYSKFITFDQVTDIANGVKNHFLKMKEFMTGYAGEIAGILNNSNVWVFPGGKTFTFKDIYFSDYQDLTTHILYTDPTPSSQNTK